MKPSIPKGTRDFSPQEMVKRNYIFDTIKQVFQVYGYQPIETPSMENLETLMGKYGEEGDKLIFKILNSGDFLAPLNLPLRGDSKDGDIKEMGSKELTKYISEKALRYDLTVPFARYVVQHQNDITFPFKRYQIQPVWRADRPQKGRYREFYQCDVDVIGSNSLLNEVELIQIIDDVFGKLGVPVIIKLNNRKILQGIAEIIGVPDRMIDIAIAIDKLDKIGIDGVEKELEEKGFLKEQIGKLRGIIISGQSPIQFNAQNGNSLQDYFNRLSPDFKKVENCKKGFDELFFIEGILSQIKDQRISIQVDFSLARGLNYYTGTIIEVKIDSSKFNSLFTSSLCGGGRYDDLTGVFDLPNISGVGISFGADRIHDVMEELGKFPEQVTISTKVMFVNFGENEAKFCLPLVADLRKNGVSAELYPDAAKFKKQMGYADDKKIAYVVFAGDDEITKGVLKIRNMASRDEKEIPVNQLVSVCLNLV